ncbi:type II toxin-antitoxin system PemK/MazF family toxin [Schaalia sp. 19OD2882]|nr:type II toxin-antitoxin system PemK/MazF family toxin [Schaalia sp. 19OD2882]
MLLGLGRTFLNSVLQGAIGGTASPSSRSRRSSASSGTATRNERRRADSRPTPRSSTPSSSASTPHRSPTFSGGEGGTGVHEVTRAVALAGAQWAPADDGDADPGEVVWTWIPYEEDSSKGKDRPVVVLSRAGSGVHVAQMTSKDHDRDAAQEARWGRYWFDIGSGDWDPQGRPSEVRLNRPLWVPASEIRREGAALPRSTFEALLEAIRDCPVE